MQLRSAAGMVGIAAIAGGDVSVLLGLGAWEFSGSAIAKGRAPLFVAIAT
jgi:hypothetical protein